MIPLFFDCLFTKSSNGHWVVPASSCMELKVAQISGRLPDPLGGVSPPKTCARIRSLPKLQELIL